MPREVSGQSNSYYVKRASRKSGKHKPGQFTGFTRKGRSLAADKRTDSDNHPKKPGYGDQGDYKK